LTPEIDTTAVREHYDREAASYDRRMEVFERIVFGEGRRWVCEQARGDVLELAAGTGRNLAFYPSAVTIPAIELSPEMLAIAQRRAAELGRPATLRLGDAQRLDFADAQFDTVVCTLSLCTIPDDGAAVAEAMRVLKPGGRFVLLEHVRSSRPHVRGGQRLLEPLFLKFQADHLCREPLEHLTAAGFVIERLERSKLGIVERVRARKP
jgi:ubiquinone/menaquinone biosynthesis C-methylase UbiE